MSHLFEPEVRCFSDAETWARAAADVVSATVRARHDEGGAILGLATGSTPLPVYRELIRRHHEEGLDFSRVRTFNLDEFVGVPESHPGSFRQFMHTHLFSALSIPGKGVPESNIHFPPTDGDHSSLPGRCERFEAELARAGGIDLQVLGIGLNGHIGFNEPGSGEESKTRLIELHPETRAPLVSVFGSLEQVPTHAVTMGVKTILSARRLLLLSAGAKKGPILQRALSGPVGPEVPASFVRRHRDARVYFHGADFDSAALRSV